MHRNRGSEAIATPRAAVWITDQASGPRPRSDRWEIGRACGSSEPRSTGPTRFVVLALLILTDQSAGDPADAVDLPTSQHP